jgi:hypothetical protein
MRRHESTHTITSVRRTPRAPDALGERLRARANTHETLGALLARRQLLVGAVRKEPHVRHLLRRVRRLSRGLRDHIELQRKGTGGRAQGKAHHHAQGCGERTLRTHAGSATEPTRPGGGECAGWLDSPPVGGHHRRARLPRSDPNQHPSAAESRTGEGPAVGGAGDRRHGQRPPRPGLGTERGCGAGFPGCPKSPPSSTSVRIYDSAPLARDMTSGSGP